MISVGAAGLARIITRVQGFKVARFQGFNVDCLKIGIAGRESLQRCDLETLKPHSENLA
jgi:hypothetical protein